MKVLLLQEIDESKILFFYRSEQEVMEVLRIGLLKVGSNIIFIIIWFRSVNTLNPQKDKYQGWILTAFDMWNQNSSENIGEQPRD